MDLRRLPSSSTSHSKPLLRQQCLYFVRCHNGQGALRGTILVGHCGILFVWLSNWEKPSLPGSLPSISFCIDARKESRG